LLRRSGGLEIESAAGCETEGGWSDEVARRGSAAGSRRKRAANAASEVERVGLGKERKGSGLDDTVRRLSPSEPSVAAEAGIVVAAAISTTASSALQKR
jgi:hypothetical protein